MKNKIILAITAITLLVSSCSKEPAKISGSGRVVLVNEGGFGHGEASISVYDPAAKVVSNNVFLSQNGFDLGDVAQSIYMIGDTAYVVMNNNSRIIVADAAHNFKYIRQIDIPGSSPRYFIPVNASKAYVTDLYANRIWIINYQTGTVTGNIPASGWTEQMIPHGGKIYVAERTKPEQFPTPAHRVLTIDPATDQITNSLSLSTDPNSFVITDQNKLYVLASRDDSLAIPASLYIVNPSSLTIEAKKDFAYSKTPGYLRYSSFAHQIMFADNGIYTMSQNDTTLPQAATITSAGWNIYGLDADPTNGDIYISDAIDYQQASRIMRYSRDGTSVDAFNAGIITNGFVFR